MFFLYALMVLGKCGCEMSHILMCCSALSLFSGEPSFTSCRMLTSCSGDACWRAILAAGVQVARWVVTQRLVTCGHKRVIFINIAHSTLLRNCKMQCQEHHTQQLFAI